MTITQKIAPNDDVLFVLNHCETEVLGSGETVLRITEQLDRKLYEATNKVLEAIGGKWNRKAKGHVFSQSNSPVEALEKLVDTGEIEFEKLDFFATPKAVINRMIKLADPSPFISVLEPSAGEGAICDALAHFGIRKYGIHFCENHPGRAKVLQDKGYWQIGTDFMECTVKYFCIVMNPPFSGGRDIDHVSHAFDLLLPAGRLVAVMAEGTFFRQDRKATAFRELIEAHGFSEELPEGAFKESGTGVKTRLVVLTK